MSILPIVKRVKNSAGFHVLVVLIGLAFVLGAVLYLTPIPAYLH